MSFLFITIKNTVITFRKGFLLLAFLGAASALFNALIPYASKFSIDALLALSTDGITFPIFYVVFLNLGVGIVNFSYGIFESSFYAKMRSFLRQLLLDRIAQISYQKISSFASGNVSNKMVAFPKAVENVMSAILLFAAPRIIFLLVAFFTLGQLHDFFIISSMIFSLLYFCFSWKAYQYVKNANKVLAEAISDVGAYIVDFVKNVILVKIFAGLKKEKEQLEYVQNTERKKFTFSGILSEKILGVQKTLFILFSVTNLLILIYLSKTGQKISAGDITMVTLTTNTLMGAVSNILNLIRSVFSDIGTLSSIESILSESDNAVEQKIHSKKVILKHFDIVFKNVSFSYDNSDKSILNNFCINIKDREKVGIYGNSGVGKSTLIKMLTKLYVPTCGTIELGGMDINELPNDLIRKYISVSSQDSPIFNRSIMDNILYSNSRASKKELERALYISGCDKQFSDLYASVGEGGNRISGGQRQRISIARTLLKPAPIMVFDEAFSAIEEDSVKDIIKMIMEYLKESTILVVSHNKWQLSMMEKNFHL